MDVTEVGKSLSNETRVKILRLLSDGPRASIETYQKYEKRYGEGKHRETIYRELENLVDVGILKKEYNETAGQIEYRLKHECLLVELDEGIVTPHERE
jgi:DNA-binding transcriptional ArsR family regulator